MNSNDPHARAQLAQRAWQHFRAGTTDLASGTLEVPLAAYTDADRYAHEVSRVFLQRPLPWALGLELPRPGDYLAREYLGRPVLLTRQPDGSVQAFLNVCRHRGAVLCPSGRGHQSRFTCPYHAWTYDAAGRLVGVYGSASFGDFDRDQRGLTRLPCVERAGLVWVVLTPGLELDIDGWLGGMGPLLESLNLGALHLFEQRELAGSGWKATLDGYLEIYHHNSVHQGTVGPHTVGNLLVHDTFGPHQRLTIARPTLDEVSDPAQLAADPDRYVRLVHSVFPNLSIPGIVGGLLLVGQVFPGPTPDRTVTLQSILCPSPPQEDAELEAVRQFSAMTLQAVRDEDYAIVGRVQAALHSGANRTFLIGRNEPAIQHYHRWVSELSA
ncbi:MAG: aromatic ring-hydroxylating oxygenase subunit alpha [Steroidobacteraceae bacterium]